jgi:hypothetical protein
MMPEQPPVLRPPKGRAKPKKIPPPVAGRWYVPRTTAKDKRARRLTPRWVLGVTSLGVIYGRGGARHYECRLDTFKRWVRETGASSQVSSGRKNV